MWVRHCHDAEALPISLRPSGLREMAGVKTRQRLAIGACKAHLPALPTGSMSTEASEAITLKVRLD